MATKKTKPVAGNREHKITPGEKSAFEKYLARKAASPAPRLKVLNNEILFNHPDEAIASVLLMEAFGTVDGDFLNGLLGQLANVGTQGRQIEERGLNFMVSVVKGIEPRDQVEAMLAAQMAAVHVASMKFARQLAHVETIQQQDSAERAFKQAHADVRNPGGGAQALPNWRRAEGHRAARIRQRRRPGDCGQRHTGSA